MDFILTPAPAPSLGPRWHDLYRGLCCECVGDRVARGERACRSDDDGGGSRLTHCALYAVAGE